ncbi:MAG TPA: thioredoxin family protein [Candidatus Kapabacteria bacterium]|nr:thioredoxin family protein [Candidatus Kapabacteria bacterium]
MRSNIRTWIAAALVTAAAGLIVGTAFIARTAQADDALAPDFTLTDIHGTQYRLADLKGKVVVLEWLNFDCPFVQKHYNSHNMQNLQRTYRDRGVVWLSIVSSAAGKEGYYSPDALNEIAQKREAAPTAILMDSDGRVGKLYGARTTPHMFVINPKGEIVYKGAIDDRRSTNPDDVKEAKNYVAAALDEVLGGKAVTVAATQPYGCSVKY